MICVHRLRGEELWLNPDLIATIEGGAQTVLTMTDGHKVILHDTPEEVAAAVREHRAEVLLLAATWAGDHPSVSTTRHLRAVHVDDE